MDLTKWISENTPPAVAIATGGSEKDFLAEVLSVEGLKLRVACDRAYAQKVAQLSNELFRNPPRTSLITKLSNHLDEAARTDDETLLVVPFNTLANFVLKETNRLVREFEILAGYDMPDWLVAQSVVAGLRGQIRDLALNGRCPVVFHDRGGGLLTMSDPDVSMVTLTGQPQAPAQDMLAAPRDPVSAPVAQKYAVLQHAEFLSSTSKPELRKMHSVGSYPAVLESAKVYWRHQLRLLLDDPKEKDDAEMLQDALSALDEVA